MRAEIVCRPVEVLDRHRLVEPRQHVRMDGLEAESHLESSAQRTGKAHRLGPHQPRVALHHHARERRGETRQARAVGRRHGARLEEVGRVVELEHRAVLDRADPGHGRLELRRKRSVGGRLVERLPPEVAEATGEGALGAGQQDRHAP